jgi:isopentenyl-diphosphate delta-isomerase
VAVLGRDADAVQATLSDLAVTVAENPAYSGPTSGSLHRGLSCLPRDVAGAVVILGDMVHVTDRMLAAIAKTATRTGASLVQSRYDDVLAPPLFLRRDLFKAVRAVTGEGVCNALVARYRDRTVFVDWPQSRLGDLDTPEDLGRLSEERVILVDADDREVGTAEKLTAHRQGRLHRAFSVFLDDRGGRTLLQRRAEGKYHSGGLWSNACCGHPRPGESTMAAAQRRLREELGVDAPLRPLGAFTYRAQVADGLVEHEVDHVFSGRLEVEPRPDPQEVAEWRWMPIDSLVADLEARPGQYSAWLKAALETYRQHREPGRETPAQSNP